MFGKRRYTRKKATHLFYSVLGLMKKKGEREGLKEALLELEVALGEKDKRAIREKTERVDQLAAKAFPKRPWHYVKEVVVAVVLALVVATVIRQMWFEPMEIPSGSMRPTFEELDKLAVTKTTFGLNVPMMPAHFMFDPARVKRTGVFIFTSEGMDIADQDTTYFGIPSKKRLIKRVMGMPGDTLYFYGGKIYGIDKDGKWIEEFETAPWLEGLEHLPMITFEGVEVPGRPSPVVFKHVNEPAGRLRVEPTGMTVGQVFNGKRWVNDEPYEVDGETIHTFSDLYGMRNFAMARLLTEREIVRERASEGERERGVLYLELRHHPSLSYPNPLIARDRSGVVRAMFNPEVSVIPLSQEHLDALMNHMYTVRFIVEGERAYSDRIKNAAARQSAYRPWFRGVPDGRYEFYYGKGYEVGFGGILKELPEDHPLYSRSPENVARLFNLGMDFNTAYLPQGRIQTFYPSRYAYFRDGDLYVMGGPVMRGEDRTLVEFLEGEERKAGRSTPSRPYLPFKDYGKPSSKEFVETFGMHIPEGMYLALGDNHAASSDSRIFGFVPQENIRGTPSVLVWPPGPRWGRVTRPHYPWITLPRLIVWGSAIVILSAFYIWRNGHRKALKKYLHNL